VRSAVPILAALLFVRACDTAPAEPRVTVEGAVVMLPIIPGRPGAAYFVLRTNNDPTRLTGVASPRIGRIELHETVSEGSVARMRPLESTTFAPDEPLAFAAGRRHARGRHNPAHLQLRSRPAGDGGGRGPHRRSRP
jgi:periplasmic copper chaperone A